MTPALRVDVISIFPDYLEPLRLSLVGKAIEAGIVDLRLHDLREHTVDRHRTVDDTPYGGGPGMVMLAEPWGRALDAVLRDGAGARDGVDVTGGPVPTLVVPTPSGRRFTQAVAVDYATRPRLVFAAGRYEGIDARVMAHYRPRTDVVVDEVCIGDYVLAGGEAAVLVIVEAVARLLPGVLGNSLSAPDDSFAVSPELVEGPVFSKPPVWRDLEVPDVLLSGHHGQIAAWRQEQAIARTQAMRPDLRPDLSPDLRPDPGT